MNGAPAPAIRRKDEVISNFQHIRRDGKVVPEGMTVVEMTAAGWVPDRVMRMPVGTRRRLWWLSGHS
jgi:hypothetical protein